ALTTNYYFDHRGDQVAESDPGGLWTKDVYDGAARLTLEYTTDGGSGTTWAGANSVASDTVLEQVQTLYDGDGNALVTLDSQRSDTATGLGPLDSETSDTPARDYTSANYYDAADRLIASVNVGTNGGSVWNAPTSAPASSPAMLVTTYDYDAAGRVED